MVASAEKLTNIGADFLICPDNTIHRVMPEVRSRCSLPWLHIAECVMAEAAENGYKRVGLTGTKFLIESNVYPEDLVRPSLDERTRINSIIFDELVYGQFRPEALGYFQGVVRRMQAKGCDAVVLGCTEIPLLVRPEDSPLPVLDSTRLLARAALKRAVA